MHENEHYVILQTQQVGDMELLVNAWMGEGWQPQGGIIAVIVPTGLFRKPGVVYLQAMIRLEK